MKKNQIAAQLFTLREFMKTPRDIADALKKVKKIGFNAVQVSGIGPIDDAELAGMLEGEGLICCATHEKGARIFDETSAVIEKLKKLNCKYTAYPSPHIMPQNMHELQTFAAALEVAAIKMSASGIVLTYHNHDLEFMKFDGHLMLDIIYDNASHLQGEIDTYWVQAGGANPVSWINKLNKRLPLMHLKDMCIINRKQTMSHIGGGNLEWNSIIPAADAAGTEWFIIEQDICSINAFDSLKLSLEYLESNFVK